MASASELLNATRGDTAQNSFLTISDADAKAVFDLSDDWDDLTDDEKAKYLVQATRLINDPLLFPGLVLGVEEEYDAAYAAAQTACYFQAVYLVRNIDDIRDAENAGAVGAKAISSPVGSVSVTAFSRFNARSPEAMAVLRPFCDFGPPRILR
ncbi:MAG: hypothetical protein AB7E51_02385 [Pseudodesulfovibrio sp.]|uniref:hypothetical protein n=1 Tax=Pseudodesulfovibrio sp. TaxID=2035812 RepID=UPI003D0D73DB